MRATDTRHSTQIFHSAKNASPIPHAGGLVHDLLIQQALDPAVTAIGYLHSASMESATIDLRTIVIERVDGKFALDLVNIRTPRSLAENELYEAVISALGFEIKPVTSATIMHEPRFSTCRAAWSHRRIVVPLGMRLEFTRVLEENSSVTVHDLCTAVSGPRDPLGAILSLTCANLLEIDFSKPFGPSSIVRAR